MNQEHLQTEVDRCLKAMETLSPQEAEDKAREIFMEAWRELSQADKDKLEVWADGVLAPASEQGDPEEQHSNGQ